MSNQRRNCLIIFVTCCVVLLLSNSYPLSVPARVIVKSGIGSVKAQLIDSNLVVWGLTKNGGFTIAMFDPTLQEKYVYATHVAGFSGSEINLERYSDTTINVQIIGNGRKQQVVLQLNEKLQQKRVSGPMGYANFSSASDQQVLSSVRTDNYSYALETAMTHPAKGEKKRVTYLKKMSHNDSLPFDSWEVIIDSTAIEYGNLISVRNGRVYLYVNHSMEVGQRLYCFDEKDGKQIYNTKLVVKSTDFKRGAEAMDMSSLEKFTASEACVYSNHFWDERTKRLTIAGTWVSSAPTEVGRSRRTGLFVMQLNDNGTINACDADYDYWLHSPTTGRDHSGEGFFSRNSETYYRVVDMGYEADGTFSLFAEIFAKVNLWSPQKPGQKEFIYLQDSAYHFYSVQKHLYSVQAGSIRPKCQECIVRTVPWAANYHLDSIKGFVAKKTKVYDEHYPDNINMICDETREDGHFVAGFRKLKNKNGTKVLTRVPVEINGQEKYAYFAKTLYVPSANWMAFLSPDPVKGQDFAITADYFAANSEWLYRLEQKNGGYELSMVKW